MEGTVAPGTSMRLQSLLNIGHGHAFQHVSLAHYNQQQSANIHKYSVEYSLRYFSILTSQKVSDTFGHIATSHVLLPYILSLDYDLCKVSFSCFSHVHVGCF